MADHDPRPPARRVPLDRERILEAAIELADAQGLDRLSMRRLGESLGVEAMALYHHVANKDELLDAMIEHVAARIVTAADGDRAPATAPTDAPDRAPTDAPPPPAHRDAAWRERLQRRCTIAYRTLVAHPWAAQLWVTRMNVGPSRMAFMELLLHDLRGAGLGEERFDLAFHTVQNHLAGHALQAVSFPFAAEDLPAMSAAYLRDFPADRYPQLAAHIAHHRDTPAGSDESSFEFGLRLLLDGLQRTAAAHEDR
ncbi:MAG: TetR/AcrR family transcriptional regulator C-terminal domain-containing protein [Nitriliruptoraceae bacterium]|nr:TetR/AcrR family transcriptional regulator C-terminal domain-containing protein [Nitriliruptoraceae bacterium]